MNQVLSKKRFGAGTNIVTCNGWLDWEMPEALQPCFEEIALEQCQELDKGDVVWIYQEFSPSGKVYGGAGFSIKKVEGNVDSETGRKFWLYHPNISYGGPHTIKLGQTTSPFMRLRDETSLLELSAKQPLLHAIRSGILAWLEFECGEYKPKAVLEKV